MALPLNGAMPRMQCSETPEGARVRRGYPHYSVILRYGFEVHWFDFSAHVRKCLQGEWLLEMSAGLGSSGEPGDVDSRPNRGGPAPRAGSSCVLLVGILRLRDGLGSQSLRREGRRQESSSLGRG